MTDLFAATRSVRIIRVPVLVLLILTASLLGTSVARADQPVVPVPSADPAMTAAFAKARSSIDAFLTQWRAPRNGANSFSVKLGLIDTKYRPGFAIVRPDQPTDAEIEWFWINLVRETGGVYEGTIGNDPESIHNVRLGQTIRFVRDDIGDWMYFRAGHIVGNATICPALAHAPEADRREMRDRYGVVCD